MIMVANMDTDSKALKDTVIEARSGLRGRACIEETTVRTKHAHTHQGMPGESNSPGFAKWVTNFSLFDVAQVHFP
jgi:hypothetical protein